VFHIRPGIGKKLLGLAVLNAAAFALVAAIAALAFNRVEMLASVAGFENAPKDGGKGGLWFWWVWFGVSKGLTWLAGELRCGRGCWKEPVGRLETPPPARRRGVVGGYVEGQSGRSGER
jgi:hypothetical protein